MKSLEQIFIDHGFHTEYQDAKEIIKDNEYLLRSNVKDKENKVYRNVLRNLHEFYYGKREDGKIMIIEIIEEFMKGVD